MGLADPRLRTSVQGQHGRYRHSRNTGGCSFAILDSSIPGIMTVNSTIGHKTRIPLKKVSWPKMTRKTSSGKSTRTRRSSLGVRNCGDPARAAERVKAEEEDALSSVVHGSPPKAMATIPASTEREKVKAKTNGRAEKKTPTLLKAEERAKTKARVKANPLPRVISPSKQKAHLRSPHKLLLQPHLPQRTGVGTLKKNGHRGKKVRILQRTINLNARKSPRRQTTKRKKLCIFGRGTDGPVHPLLLVFSGKSIACNYEAWTMENSPIVSTPCQSRPDLILAILTANHVLYEDDACPTFVVHNISFWWDKYLQEGMEGS